MKMLDDVFKYCYYRIAKLYMKSDGMESYRAVVIISVVQTLLIFDLFLIFMKYIFGWTELSNYAKTGGYIGICLLILLGILNAMKFKNKYNEYKNRWGQETVFQKRLRGILVVFVLVMPFVLVSVI